MTPPKDADQPIAANPEILDVCCGGRMWWWDKEHPLAVYMDKRSDPQGSHPHRPNWKAEPDLVGDFRELPFDDDAFQLVLFDPPHIVSDKTTGFLKLYYGALPRETEQADLRRGFAECWRVLAPGGTLVFKWSGALDRVRPHFPALPIVGTRSRGGLGRGDAAGKIPTGPRWFVFYKPLYDSAELTARQEALDLAV